MLLRRMPDLTLQATAPEWREIFTLRGRARASR
jgi:hypothetical protein